MDRLGGEWRICRDHEAGLIVTVRTESANDFPIAGTIPFPRTYLSHESKHPAAQSNTLVSGPQRRPKISRKTWQIR